MTIKQVYESILIELNKVKAPSLLLNDFIYFWNKTVIQNVNLEYNSFNINQQKTDNLSSLARTYVASGTDISPITTEYNTSVLHDGTFVINLPRDYNHLLNCIIEFEPINSINPCNGVSNNIFYGARRLTEDQSPTILRNYYFKPSIKNPYYFIHNIDALVADSAERNLSPSAQGYRMEIRIGRDISRYEIVNIFVDYLRTPTYVELTQDDLDDLDDNSEILEFPDYVCQEMINRCVSLILENQSNPRLNTNIPINQTIAPAQQQYKK